MELLLQPSESSRLGDCLKANLAENWTQFRAAVAFVKRSGVKHVAAQLDAFAKAGDVQIILGIDHKGTSYEGLEDLLKAVSPKGRVIVFHNRLPYTFHPKLYLFKSATKAEVIVGSGNLTEGGLFTNYEASTRFSLDLAKPEDVMALRSVEHALDGWSNLASGTALVLDEGLLRRLRNLRLVPMEVDAPSPSQEWSTPSGAVAFPFAARWEPRPPSGEKRASSGRAASAGDAIEGTVEPSERQSPVTCFVMTLQQTDVGVGQTSKGASRRSPELFIPLSARDAHPLFWAWRDGFTEDPTKPGKFDRLVRMRLGGVNVSVNMMTWPDRRDFRLRCEALRSAGNVGDVLRIEKVGPGLDFEYYVEVIPAGTASHTEHLLFCTGVVRNSRKRYGYY